MGNDSHSNTKNSRNTWAAQDYMDGRSDEDEDDTHSARKRKKMFINMDKERDVQEVSPWKWKGKGKLLKEPDRLEGWVVTLKMSELGLVFWCHWPWWYFYSSIMFARAIELCTYGASKQRNGTWNGCVRHALGQGFTARSKVSPIMFLFCYLFAKAEHRSVFYSLSMEKGSWITDHCFGECWNHTKGPVPCDEWVCFETGENMHFWPKGHFWLAGSGQRVKGKGGRVQCLMAKIPPFWHLLYWYATPFAVLLDWERMKMKWVTLFTATITYKNL